MRRSASRNHEPTARTTRLLVLALAISVTSLANDVVNLIGWFRAPVSRMYSPTVFHNANVLILRLELYLMENFRHAFDMESYVYYTQVMQAETLAAAYR